MDESWKQIPGWPGYEVSNIGRVRRGDHIKSPFCDRKGYLKVKLWNRQTKKNLLVHRLVALAFIGLIPTGNVCRHLNGDMSDNRIENLSYGTRSENEADKKGHGTAAVGGRHPAAKLTEEQVKEIRAAFISRDPEFGCTALATKYGVATCSISSIVSRRIWKHVA